MGGVDLARARKKVIEVVEEEKYPEFGFVAKDEDGVLLIVESNAGKDKKKFLEHAKEFKRPINISIESELFTSYKFTNFALTKEEVRNMIRELNRMLDYLED